jgi:hypothetical protein
VPEEVAEQVINALGKSNLRGKKVQVRRDAGPRDKSRLPY